MIAFASISPCWQHVAKIVSKLYLSDLLQCSTYVQVPDIISSRIHWHISWWLHIVTCIVTLIPSFYHQWPSMTTLSTMVYIPQHIHVSPTILSGPTLLKGIFGPNSILGVVVDVVVTMIRAITYSTNLQMSNLCPGILPGVRGSMGCSIGVLWLS